MGAAAVGQPATEDFCNPDHPSPRVASELAGRALSGRGVNVLGGWVVTEQKTYIRPRQPIMGDG
jgi:hypothetical protein